MPRPSRALPLILLLAGCRLVDQRTFERAGFYPGATQLQRADYAQRALPPPPLVTIRFGGQPDSGWQTVLVEAAREARGRKSDVSFDLVTPIPTTASLAVQDAAQRTGAADAQAVAMVLEGDGVSPDQIRLGARGDAGQPPREIEVYVR